MTKKLFILVLMLAMCLALSAQTKPSAYKKPKKWSRILVVPITLIAGGFYTINEKRFINRFSVRAERNEEMPLFHYHIDDYLQYAPAVAVYALAVVGKKGKNDWKNRTLLLIKSELLMTAVVLPIKKLSRQLRPDGSNYRSFPSGHTAQAFVAATFLHQEFGHKSVWYSIGGYTVATAVGTLRILNNKHWISDVLVGAGIGILSTNLVYRSHRYRFGKKPALTIVPTYAEGPGLYLSYKF
jgi:membrane-associated phospholipid phosphatase